MNEMDLTTAEKKATYEEIKAPGNKHAECKQCVPNTLNRN